MNPHDRDILRALAAETADIAALPVQEEKRRLWRRLNARAPERPMVMIDQVCWNEMAIDDELALLCIDPECRQYEEGLRRTLFQWRHFPVDMVIEPFLRVPRAVRNTGFGIEVDEEIAVTDPHNDVVGRRFRNQLQGDADIERMRLPRISHDEVETERRLAVAHGLFDGVLEVRPWGLDPYLSLWDPISMWMGVEGALYALMDRPDFMHRLVGRMTDGYLSMLDQLEEQGLLCQPQSLIHCTGAWTDELPAPGYDPGQAAHEGRLDVRPRADVLHGLPCHVQGVRGRLREPHLRPVRPRLLWVLRPPGRQDGGSAHDPECAQDIHEPVGRPGQGRGAHRMRLRLFPQAESGVSCGEHIRRRAGAG